MDYISFRALTAPVYANSLSKLGLAIENAATQQCTTDTKRFGTFLAICLGLGLIGN